MTSEREREELIERVYLDAENPFSFSPLGQFRDYLESVGIQITRKDLTRLLRRRFAGLTTEADQQNRLPYRRMLIPRGLDTIFACDLFFLPAAQMRRVRGKAFIVLVEVLSHYVWLGLLKNKTPEQVCAFLQKVFESGRIPETIIFDEGGEFLSYKTREFLRRWGVHPQFTTQRCDDTFLL